MNAMQKPAIVLSGYTMALGVARALGAKGVPVIIVHYDGRDMAHLSRHVRESIRAPHPEKDEPNFIGLLLSLKERYPGAMLLPASDETTSVLSRHKDVLETFFSVACPEWEVTQRFIEKKNTYALAEACGVPAPKTILPKSLKDVENYASMIDFPCLVKPSQSHMFYERFKTKMVVVRSPKELMTVYRCVKDAGLEVLLQEIIHGPDSQVVNYNAFTCNGKMFVEFTARHIRNAPPSFGSPRVVVSERIPEVIEPGRKILKAMGFRGYACTEFKKDARDGMYKLMEVNGRHNLSTLLAVKCGINFPWLHYRHLLYGDIPRQVDFIQGLYWVDFLRDAGYSLSFYSTERYSLREYVEPYLKNHVFAILDLKDFKPFAKRVHWLMNSACRSKFLSKSRTTIEDDVSEREATCD